MSKTIHEERSCREKSGIVLCQTVFRLVFDEERGAFIIEYRGRKTYLPPVVSSDRIPLPLKYAKLFDPEIFPEIVPRRYGRW